MGRLNDANAPRFFYNQDMSFVINHPLVPPMTKELFACGAVGGVLGTQVDAVAVNFFNFGDFAPYYPSDVPETRRVYPEGETVDWVLEWVLGNDPWPYVVETAHEGGLQFWAKMRFNDMHPRPWHTEFRENHREYELGDRCPMPWHKPGAFFVGERCRAYNFMVPEVRDHQMALVEEVCSKYDVEGFEWDFMRPRGHYFPVVEAGAPVMTEHLRRARATLDRVGERRGRPLGFGVRVPAPLANAKAVGLDADTWMREGLVDYVSPSSGFSTVTNPLFEEFVALGRETGVRVYGCPSEMLDARWSAPGQLGPPPAEAIRAGALNAWRQGVDGVHLNNFNQQIQFERKEDLWLLSQLGDVSTLEFADKQHSLLAHHTRDFLPAGEYQVPLELGPGESGTLRLFVGDDLERARAFGRVDRVTLKLRVNPARDPKATRAAVLLNGRPLPPPPSARPGLGLTRKLGVSLAWNLGGGEALRMGPNELTFRVTDESTTGLVVREVVVDIRYRLRFCQRGITIETPPE